MAGTTEGRGTAPANPDGVAPSKNQGEDAKPPAEDVKPPLLFVGKTFHIASSFPEWYDSKLKQDIQVTPFTAQKETSYVDKLTRAIWTEKWRYPHRRLVGFKLYHPQPSFLLGTVVHQLYGRPTSNFKSRRPCPSRKILPLGLFLYPS